MQFCINCGKSIGPDAQFCMNCGSKVASYENDPSSGGIAQKNQPIALPLPEEIVIPKGSGKGSDYEAAVWLLRIGFFVMLFMILSNLSRFTEDPIVGIMVLIGVSIMLFGPELFIFVQRGQLVRLVVNKNGIFSDEYRVFFGLKKQAIRIDISNIDKIETIYVSSTSQKISSHTEKGAVFNTLVVYLKDGKIFSFMQRDHDAICMARSKLSTLIPEINEENTSSMADDLYTYIKIKNNIDRRSDYFIALAMSLPIIFLLFTAIRQFLRPEPSPDQMVFAFVCIAVAIVFLALLLLIFRQSSVREVEMKVEGIQLTTRFGEKLIRWDQIKEIKLGSGASVTKAKNRMAFICLSERNFFKVTYDIGVKAQYAYERSTGQAPPKDVIGRSPKYQEARVQELDIIQRERPDLIRRKQLVTNGSLVALVLTLVGFVTDYLIIFVIAVLAFFFLIILGKRTEREIKRHMESRWAYQMQAGIEKR